jgi:hypothetical protein
VPRTFYVTLSGSDSEKFGGLNDHAKGVKVGGVDALNLATTNSGEKIGEFDVKVTDLAIGQITTLHGLKNFSNASH